MGLFDDIVGCLRGVQRELCKMFLPHGPFCEVDLNKWQKVLEGAIGVTAFLCAGGLLFNSSSNSESDGRLMAWLINVLLTYGGAKVWDCAIDCFKLIKQQSEVDNSNLLTNNNP